SFEGWGTSLAWWASFAGQQNMNVQTNLLDAFFNVNSGLGFNIVRYNIGAGARQDELQYYGNYRAMPAWQAASNVAMDPTADIGQLNILRGAMARGVNIIEAFANSPPPWMTISGSSMGQPDGSDNLSPARYAEYANYMARAVQWLNSQGVPVRTVAAMNEPSAGWWLQHKDSNKSQEGCAINRANHNGIYQAMSLALQRFGSTTVISAADENSLTAASDSLKLMGNFPRVQQINIHGYFATIDFDTNLVNEFRARVGNRRLWMSEFGLPGQDMTSGIALALSIVRDLVQLRVQAWVYWQALDEGDEWGLINAPLASTHFENGLPQIGKQYWVIAQFCKHIRPGWSIVGTTATADLRTVAAVPPNRSSLVIVVVN
ncbi:glycoside hydrolase, partial [Caulochytrium protostelioides]